MELAFFTWTMRRTGGSSLISLLEYISKYPKIVHEPFNSDRKFGHITKTLSQSSNAETKDLIHLALNECPNIKHCYEITPTKLNNILIDTVGALPYKHLFLKRNDEASRILSLFLALQTDVWGLDKVNNYNAILNGDMQLKPFDIDAMIEHTKWCEDITQDIKSMLKSKGIPYKEISFEDFYEGEREERLKNLDALFEFLEFDDYTQGQYTSLIEEKIFNSSQNSKSILKYVPNYKEAIEALDLTISSKN